MKATGLRLSACLLVVVSLGLFAFYTSPATTAAQAIARPTRTRYPTPTVGGSLVPLIDMGSQTYFGFEGGLYPGATNTMPLRHANDGAGFTRSMRPRNTNGQFDRNGKIVLLSIGMSNATQEYCFVAQNPDCNSWTFAGQAATDSQVNHSSLAIVDGADSGAVAPDWTSPDSYQYDRVRDQQLSPKGLSELQVEAVWLKEADANPGQHTPPLPSPNADAYLLESELGDIARALHVRYPNLEMVFLSSRTYAGYATVPLNPEPYAYESGFAVKWLIAAQINQIDTGQIDPVAGDLSYSQSPWLAWDAYLWADGTHSRSDGLTWDPGDVELDGTHPSQSGETKVGSLLLSFFKTSPQASCWFLAGASCRPSR